MHSEALTKEALKLKKLLTDNFCQTHDIVTFVCKEAQTAKNGRKKKSGLLPKDVCNGVSLNT